MVASSFPRQGVMLHYSILNPLCHKPTSPDGEVRSDVSSNNKNWELRLPGAAVVLTAR